MREWERGPSQSQLDRTEPYGLEIDSISLGPKMLFTVSYSFTPQHVFLSLKVCTLIHLLGGPSLMKLKKKKKFHVIFARSFVVETSSHTFFSWGELRVALWS